MRYKKSMVRLRSPLTLSKVEVSKSLLRAKSRSFTLIELLVVIAIIGILASMIIVNVSAARARGRDSKRQSDVQTIQMAMEMYYEVKGSYPSCSYSPDKSCAASSSINAGANARYKADWNELETALQPYLSKLPRDPINNAAGAIYCWNENNCYGITTTATNTYIVYTRMETIKGNGADYYYRTIGNIVPPGCTSTSGPMPNTLMFGTATIDSAAVTMRYFKEFHPANYGGCPY